MTTVTEERTKRCDEFVDLLHRTLQVAFQPDVAVTRHGNWITVTYDDLSFNIVVSTKRGS